MYLRLLCALLWLAPALTIAQGYTPHGGSGGGGLDPANNLSDVANVATSRSNLGLEIGVDVQAWAAELDQLDTLGAAPAADRYIYSTGAGLLAWGTATAAGRALFDDATALAQTQTLGVEVGVDVPALTAGLGAISTVGAPTAADEFLYSTGAGTWSLGTVTAAGRALLDDATAAAQRATLGAAPAGSWHWTARAAYGLDAGEFGVEGHAPTVGDFTDVADVGSGWSGSQTLATYDAPASIDSMALRMTPTTGTDGQGVARTVAAGDFVYASEFSTHIVGDDLDELTTLDAMFVFVDGQDVSTDTWYGAGFSYAASDFEKGRLVAAQGANFDTVSAYDELTTWQRATTVSVWLRRSGTTLTAWVATGRGSVPRQAGEWTVTAGAGLIGWRVEASASHSLIATAFAEVSEVPGQ